MTTSVNIDDLLNGASLRVVLHPHPEVQIQFPSMIESFELPHITLIGDRFFAKTANRHAVSFLFKGYDIKAAFSYAYSNHYDFVVNSSHTEGYSLICSVKMYKEVSFITAQNYEPIWDSEQSQSTKPVEAAILSGRQLKIALLDQDDIWNITPVHMPSFYVDKNYFELFTQQDSIPGYLRHTKQLETISKQHQSSMEDHIRKNLSENKTASNSFISSMDPNTVFFSNYYTIRSRGEYLRGKIAITQEQPQTYKSLKVFAEA